MSPDYTIYPDNNISYGFITRGCIRNCYFCKVPEKEGYIRQVCTVDEIVNHDKVCFMDNNILAFPNHLLILQEIVDKKIRCQFKQGLDIRLLNEENSLLLSKIKHSGEIIFAFDDWKYKNTIEDKMKFLSWRKNFQIKMYIYVHPSMPVSDTINRINWCKDNKILPYIMRDISCFDDINNKFYIDLACYCNQPNIFKKMDFVSFLNGRHKNNERIQYSKKMWESN